MGNSLVRFSVLPALLFLLASCAQRPVMTSGSGAPIAPGLAAPASTETPSSAETPASPASATGAGVTRVSATASHPKEFMAVADLKPIHFDFDKYDVRPAEARILDENARWMKANPTYLVLVEGHADERGTNEYNLALAERRAKATLNYLLAQGVAAPRMSLISYGEERPVCGDKQEACWSKNRRAQSLVKAR